MATSLPDVKIPTNKWIDLYSETGISVGTQIIVQNKGDAEAELSESLLEPIETTGSNKIPQYTYLTNATAAVGAWAFSKLGTVLHVEEA